MMSRIFRYAMPVALAGVIAGANADELPLVPLPADIQQPAGQPAFVLAGDTPVKCEDVAASFAAKSFEDWRDALKLDNKNGAGAVRFVKAEGELGKEAYELTVNEKEILVKASTAAGFLYGAATLRQLMPAAAKDVSDGVAVIPAMTIKDEPRFAWRGVMIDCVRHWWPKEELKKIIDLMASLKMNIWHWHLTDDQGWRLEIKKYPELTEKGAWRSSVGFGLPKDSTTHYREDGMYGGFYTQEDVKELIKYAAERNITIVPEIEMPGHATAMLHVFPQFGCKGGPYEIMQTAGVAKTIACAGNEDAMKFYEDVLTEVAALFPGEYVHIGGDEALKDEWSSCPKCQARIKELELKNEDQLQNWVTGRMEKHLNKLGKRLIGWDEILEGDNLTSTAVVQCWRTWKSPWIAAAKNGNQMVMSPTSHCYLDYRQGPETTEPLAIGDSKVRLPLEKVYEFEPINDALTDDQIKLVKGGQVNVWTEFIANEDHLEYMLAPRICAAAEALWSPKKARDWDSFRARLEGELKQLDAMKIHYRIPDPVKE